MEKDNSNDRTCYLMVSDDHRPRPRVTPEELQDMETLLQVGHSSCCLLEVMLLFLLRNLRKFLLIQWDTHLEELADKLTSVAFAINSQLTDVETLARLVYYTYFHSILSGMLLWVSARDINLFSKKEP